ncbi:hypothetical protein ACHAWC_001482 [Mediolabrus comicus]
MYRPPEITVRPAQSCPHSSHCLSSPVSLLFQPPSKKPKHKHQYKYNEDDASDNAASSFGCVAYKSEDAAPKHSHDDDDDDDVNLFDFVDDDEEEEEEYARPAGNSDARDDGADDPEDFDDSTATTSTSRSTDPVTLDPNDDHLEIGVAVEIWCDDMRSGRGGSNLELSKLIRQASLSGRLTTSHFQQMKDAVGVAIENTADRHKYADTNTRIIPPKGAKAMKAKIQAAKMKQHLTINQLLCPAVRYGEVVSYYPGDEKASQATLNKCKTSRFVETILSYLNQNEIMMSECRAFPDEKDEYCSEEEGRAHAARKWVENITLLQQYESANGNCDVPRSYKVGDVNLGKWVGRQRHQYKLFQKGQHSHLTQERIQQLNGLDFIWVVGAGRGEAKAKTDARKWVENITLLQQYESANGNCDVPTHYEVDGVNLGKWVDRQRCQYKLFQKGQPSQLTDERIQQLNGLGFAWVVGTGRGEAKAKTDASKWDKQFRLLQQYESANGNCDVPRIHKVGDVKLGTWVDRQRCQYKLFQKGQPSQLTDERIQRLNSLDFTWVVGRGKGKRK